MGYEVHIFKSEENEKITLDELKKIIDSDDSLHYFDSNENEILWNGHPLGGIDGNTPRLFFSQGKISTRHPDEFVTGKMFEIAKKMNSLIGDDEATFDDYYRKEIEESCQGIIERNKNMTENNYPGVLDRVKAVVADSVVLVILMLMITYVFSAFENVPDNARMFAFIFIFILYDPLFTSIFGGTLGHMAFGIRVKSENDITKNIYFPFAIIRFAAKALLGCISLISVQGNSKKKAIHDIISGSVVVFEKKTDKK